MKQKKENYTHLYNFDILKVYEFQARRLEAIQDNRAVWKGGDDEDRLNFIKAKKKELGNNIDRVLALSSKRTPMQSKVF